METTPTVDQAADYFNAHTVRFYNSTEEEFMKLRTDRASKRFHPLFDEKLMGVRHAEDGRLYAILADPDPGKAPYEEPVDVFPFAEMDMATRPYADGEADALF